MTLDDLVSGNWYTLRYIKHYGGVRYDTTLTMPLLLHPVQFVRGKPLTLYLWSQESGRVVVSWYDVKELTAVVKARIAE